jgi:hypothetical protein
MMRPGAPAVLSARAPAVRGSYMRQFAGHVARLPQTDRARIQQAVPAAFWHDVEASGTFTWLPIEVNLRCTRAVGEQLSHENFMRFFRTLLLDTTRSPLLHGFVESVLRIAVRDPGMYLVWVTKGYQLLFSNAGSWTIRDRAPGFARLALTDAPTACLADPMWLESLRGGLLSLFDLTHLVGTTEIVERRSGVVVYESRWSTG